MGLESFADNFFRLVNRHPLKVDVHVLGRRGLDPPQVERLVGQVGPRHAHECSQGGDPEFGFDFGIGRELHQDHGPQLRDGWR